MEPNRIRWAYYMYQGNTGYWYVAPLNDHRVRQFQCLKWALTGRSFSSREAAERALADAASAAAAREVA